MALTPKIFSNSNLPENNRTRYLQAFTSKEFEMKTSRVLGKFQWSYVLEPAFLTTRLVGAIYGSKFCLSVAINIEKKENVLMYLTWNSRQNHATLAFGDYFKL